MSEAENKLKELNALQDLQNATMFGKRLEMLESDMERISTIVSNIKLTLAQLQMDFDRNRADMQSTAHQ